MVIWQHFLHKKQVVYSNILTYTRRLTMNHQKIPGPFSLILRKHKIEPNHSTYKSFKYILSIWLKFLCFTIDQGDLNSRRYNWIFVTYFLLWYLMNFIYLPNDSKLRKTRACSYFYDIPCYHSLLNILSKTLIHWIL